MHTMLVIGGGLLLAIVFGLFGYLWGDTSPNVALALRLFIPAWFILTGVNLWIGVTRAGYTVLQELPIQALVFAVPAAAALACSLLLNR